MERTEPALARIDAEPEEIKGEVIEILDPVMATVVRVRDRKVLRVIRMETDGHDEAKALGIPYLRLVLERQR